MLLEANSPVSKRTEACVRNATAKHVCIVWLDGTVINLVLRSLVASEGDLGTRLNSQFQSQIVVSQPPSLFFVQPSVHVIACFTIALWVHLGHIPLVVLLPAN